MKAWALQNDATMAAVAINTTRMTSLWFCSMVWPIETSMAARVS